MGIWHNRCILSVGADRIGGLMRRAKLGEILAIVSVAATCLCYAVMSRAVPMIV